MTLYAIGCAAHQIFQGNMTVHAFRWECHTVWQHTYFSFWYNGQIAILQGP